MTIGADWRIVRLMQPAIRVMMMPRDTNAHGTIFGGHILSLLDQAGAVAAHAIGARKVVTVAVREVVFKEPVHVGDIVSLYAEVTNVGSTSLTIRVRVEAHEPIGGRSVEVTTAELVYVQVDDRGRPVPIQRTLPPRDAEC
ncbi:acyl-CoA thioesterase YciA [Nannocystis exedens]|uniref:Acyl-CoA thioesterase YciA n=2 Tax=Nannocystaceae TaxID=224463 RepID=A0A1I1W8E2_9BACT|nr:acyl-CoA thioesterase [Nannocystis exedens]SFD91407.1 acyl-CoA thioesterase YciA [Nannocystis exedens]